MSNHIKIISTTGTSHCIKLPDPPSPLYIWMAAVMNNILDEAHMNKGKEIEIAHILHEFVTDNARLFSKPVLAAAKVLLEEIKKVED